MKIIWYGTASLRVESESGSLLIDPFGQMPIGREAQKNAVEHSSSLYSDCGNVLVTHGHADHISHFGTFFAGKPVRIYATETPCKTLLHHGINKDQLTVISDGWQGNVDGIKVTAFRGRHCRFDLPLVIKVLSRPTLWRHIPSALHLLRLICTYPEHKETVLYQIEADGVRIQVMGSMNLDDKTEYPTGADVLILPLQGRSDQDLYALRFVDRLRPREVWLDHYDNAFPPISDDVETSGFVRNVEETFGIPCIPMVKEEWREIKIKKGEMGKWVKKDVSETDVTEDVYAMCQGSRQ